LKLFCFIIINNSLVVILVGLNSSIIVEYSLGLGPTFTIGIIVLNTNDPDWFKKKKKKSKLPGDPQFSETNAAIARCQSRGNGA
jgi:hypothetical protein